MHPGSHDDEENIELTSTGIEMEDDDRNIKRVHERESLMGRVKRVPERSCLYSSCRICLGISATAVFCFMLIQLWTNYGDMIKQRVYSPAISATGCFDDEGSCGESFLMDFHKWDNHTIHLNTSKPKNDLVQVNFKTPQEWDYKWGEKCLQISVEEPAEFTVMVWSV